MNLKNSRVGILQTPTTPLWSGTVVSYSTADEAFTLVVTPTTGLASVAANMVIHYGNELVRIKTVDSGTGTLTLAQNGVSFPTDAAIAIYNVYYPLPRYQRILQDYVVEEGDVNDWFSDWKLYGVTYDPTWDGTIPHKTFYWSFWHTYDDFIGVYSGSGCGDDELVCSGKGINGTVTLKERNKSGISGSVVIANATGDTTSNILTVHAYRLFKDWDIEWEDLGVDNQARSVAQQIPMPCVTPTAICCEIAEEFSLDASASFATYGGESGSNPLGKRVLAHVDTWTWTPGTGGTVVSGQGTATPVISYSTAAFRYLQLTVTDSNGTTSDRFIPVWVGVAPNTNIVSCTLSMNVGRGFEAQLEFESPPTLLRHGLVALVDLDTYEILFVGYVWPLSYRYDFEHTTASFTAQTDFGFLEHVYSYPFQLIGERGEPILFDHIDVNSVPRGIYHVCRWQSTCHLLMNISVDTAPDQRQEYIRYFTAGSILDQISEAADSGKYSVYPLRTGGVKIVNGLLYRAAIDDAYADALTFTLTEGQYFEPVNRSEGAHRISDLRVSGWYYNESWNVYPIIVRSPQHPSGLGSPGELGGLVFQGPGYSEALQIASRHIGIANTSQTLSVVTSDVDVPLGTYYYLDIPGESRIVIESQTYTYDSHALCWTLEITGRTFGETGTSVVEPPGRKPSVPEKPPVLPEPPPYYDASFLMSDSDGVATSNIFYSDFQDTGAEWPDISSLLGDACYLQADNVDVAVDRWGNSHVVFLLGSSDPKVYYIFRPNGGVWQTKELVSDSASGIDCYPRIAVDIYGTAYVIWYSYSNVSLRFSWKALGETTWAASVSIAANGTAFRAAIAVDDVLNIHVVYALSGLYYRRKRAGQASWDDAVQISSLVDCSVPDIDVFGITSRHAVFTRSGTNEIYYSELVTDLSGGAWSEPIALTTGGISASPRIGVDLLGNIHVVWSERVTAIIQRIKHRVRTYIGTEWEAESTVADNIKGDEGTSPLCLSVNEDGDAFCGIGENYSISANPPYHVYIAVLPVGGIWGALDEVYSSTRPVEWSVIATPRWKL